MAPVRTCVGCRVRRPPGEMIRVAMRDGRLVIGPAVGGRGAWMCPRVECCDLAIKRRAVPRALRNDIPSGALEELRTAIATGTVFPPGARS